MSVLISPACYVTANYVAYCILDYNLWVDVHIQDFSLHSITAETFLFALPQGFDECVCTTAISFLAFLISRKTIAQWKESPLSQTRFLYTSRHVMYDGWHMCCIGYHQSCASASVIATNHHRLTQCSPSSDPLICALRLVWNWYPNINQRQ